jgi:CRISPR type III-B/RAMP module RAMP protein Cmr1
MNFDLAFVSPAFLYGAYQRGPALPELRAPSLRGQLRYWLRAIAGARYPTLHDVYKAEEIVFGSTQKGSAVIVRLYASRIDTQTTPMLPHREGTNKPVSSQDAIRIGQRATLELVTRPGVTMPDDALHALKVWSLIGGIGKRSCRMFGAVRLTPSDVVGVWYESPDSPVALATLINNTLTSAIGTIPAPIAAIPDFPTLRPDHSWVVVCADGHANPLDANQWLFRNLLRSAKYRPHEDTFGFARGGRRVSPLIAQVRRIGDTYYPVLTAIRSRPDRRIEWNILRDFMLDVETTCSGLRAWGGWS